MEIKLPGKLHSYLVEHGIPPELETRKNVSAVFRNIKGAKIRKHGLNESATVKLATTDAPTFLAFLEMASANLFFSGPSSRSLSDSFDKAADDVRRKVSKGRK